MTKVNIVFHSIHSHTYRMANAVAEGARQVDGVEVGLYRVQETFAPEILEKMGALEAFRSFEHIPEATPEVLEESDAVIFGTPTRFGNMTAQMRAFLDRTGKIWMSGGLIGKIGSVFTSSGTQHGGQESTILTFHTNLLHHGMVVVGTPYSEKRQMSMDEITGGSPYGASTIAGPDGSRMPSENELEIARFQGRHVAELARRMEPCESDHAQRMAVAAKSRQG